MAQLDINVALTGRDVLSHIDHLNQTIANYESTLEWILMSLENRKLHQAVRKGVLYEDAIAKRLEELFNELKK